MIEIAGTVFDVFAARQAEFRQQEGRPEFSDQSPKGVGVVFRSVESHMFFAGVNHLMSERRVESFARFELVAVWHLNEVPPGE